MTVNFNRYEFERTDELRQWRVYNLPEEFTIDDITQENYIFKFYK